MVAVHTPPDLLFFVDLLVDLHFLADMPLRARTAFFETTTGALITDSRKIAQEYLRGWFALDFICCLPFSYLALSDDDAKSTALTQVRMLKVLRLLKLTTWLWPSADGTHSRKQGTRWITQHPNALLVLRTCAGVAVSIHLTSCGWWLLGSSAADGWSNSTVLPWSDGTDSMDTLSGQYAAAVYGVVSARGAWAGRPAEFVYCIVLEAMLTLVWITLIAAAITIMNSGGGGFGAGDGGGSGASGYLAVSTVADWAAARGLSHVRAAEVEECYRCEQGGLGNARTEARVLAELPVPLATKVALDLYLVFIQRLPFFRGLTPAVLGGLCRSVTLREISKGTALYSEGDAGTEFYFVITGEVEVEQAGERLGFLGRGSFFGEASVVEAAASTAIGDAGVRTRTIRATMPTELGVIRRESVMDLWKDYPELKVRLLTFANLGKEPLHNCSTKRMDAIKWRHEIGVRALSDSDTAEIMARDGGPVRLETLQSDRLLLRTRIDRMEENQSRQLADCLMTVNKMRSDQIGAKSQIDSMHMEMVELGAKMDGFFKMNEWRLGRSPTKGSPTRAG